MSLLRLFFIWLLFLFPCWGVSFGIAHAGSLSRTELTLRIDPNFSEKQLPIEAGLWYSRFWAGLRNPSQYPNATTLAQSNDTYQYGRALNTHITTILQLLRVTGDQRLLDEVDRLAELMRAQLKDKSILTKSSRRYQTDGYVNWLWHYNDARYVGTDVHEMDEILTHSLVAAMAYAFYVNRDVDLRYAKRAQFWTNYLKNHFEAKWRKRQKIPAGFPFLEKKLTHVYIQFVRYHFYMAKLTGEKAYENEALRMSDILNHHIKAVSTPIGTGAIWDHGMPILNIASYGVQETHYARYTVQAAADLALEGFSIFAQPGFMDRMAVTLANFVLVKNGEAYARAIDGSGSGGERLERYAISPWAMLGRWDKSGKVQAEANRVYRKIELSPEKPRSIYLPAGIVFSLIP
jgi:hypothetical protein